MVWYGRVVHAHIASREHECNLGYRVWRHVHSIASDAKVSSFACVLALSLSPRCSQYVAVFGGGSVWVRVRRFGRILSKIVACVLAFVAGNITFQCQEPTLVRACVIIGDALSMIHTASNHLYPVHTSCACGREIIVRLHARKQTAAVECAIGVPALAANAKTG